VIRERSTLIVKGSIKHILFPTDFSHLAHEAINTVTEIARATGARVTVLHVDESPLMHRYWQYAPETGRSRGRKKDVRETIAERLEDVVAGESWKGIEAEKAILEGTAAFEIVSCAKRKKVDLIIIPCQGESPYKENLLGGTARKVAEQAPCSVLLVRRPGRLPTYDQAKSGS
jgi:nucleotide-binding universal stress UspA family protein